MKVLVVGSVCFDTFISVDGYPKENNTYRVKEKIECPGGSGFTSSVLLSSWGIDTYFSGNIGEDKIGSKILEYAKDCGINVDYVTKEEKETTRNYYLINRYNTSNTKMYYIQDESFNKDISYDFDPDIILSDATEGTNGSKTFERFPKSIKVVYLDSINENGSKLCALSDYIICPKANAEIITKTRINYTDPDSLKIVLNILNKMYNSEVIVTLGNKGCLYKIGDKIKIMGAMKVYEKDTTGAGSIFAGAFTYGLSKYLPVEKCLKIATIAAGLSVKEIGSTTSIPEVLGVYEIYEKNK